MSEHPVILFDGVCNFCNGAINLIIRNDKKRLFRFAPLQSKAGQDLLRLHGLSPTEFDSFVLVYKGRTFKKTTASLHIAQLLGGAWRLTGIGWIFPAFIRDLAYTLIAKNRYRWFGKKDSCMIPTPEVRSLFLD